MGKPSLTLLLASLVLTAPLPCAKAADKLWLFMGDVYKDDYYFSLGVLIPFSGSNLGNGWVQRYWVDTYSYSYDTNGQRIDANVYGGEAMVGYQKSAPGLSGAAYVGVRYSNTGLNPDDPGNVGRGDLVRPKAQLEGTAALNPRWRAEGIFSFTFGVNDYWARARLLRDLSGTHYAGGEVISQGDRYYNALKIGAVYGGVQLSEKTFLTVKGGYRFQSGANSPYVGLELVGEF